MGRHIVETLIIQCMPHIDKHCRTRIRFNKHIKFEDLKSVALERIWKGRDVFVGDKDDFARWTSVIIRNCYIDLYRKMDDAVWMTEIKETHRKSNTKQLSDHDIDHILTRMDEILIAEDSVKGHSYVTAMKLLIEGYEYQEIADRLLMNMNTLKPMIHKIRNLLKSKMSVEMKLLKSSI